jgi:hypothetical protein
VHQRLQVLVERTVDRRRLAQAVLGVAEGAETGRLVVAADDARPGEPMRPNTPLFIASVTKRFIATLVLQAHERGELDLDSPITWLVVVGDGFTLEGIISRSNVVAALARSDRDIEDETRSRIVNGLLGLEPQAVAVSVEDGIATFGGSVTHRREADRLQRLASRVLGVSRVDSSVTWHVDHLGVAGRVPRFGNFTRRSEPPGEENPTAVDVDGPSGRKGTE